jgi:hypothetical protein
MSSIDLTNPKVLKTYLTTQAQEGKGKFYIKTQVVCFKNEEGFEFIVPDDLAKIKLAELKEEGAKTQGQVVQNSKESTKKIKELYNS